MSLFVTFLPLPVYSVRLPGREKFFQNMQQIVDEVIEALLPALKEKPFAFFGHRYGTNEAEESKRSAFALTPALSSDLTSDPPPSRLVPASGR